MAQKGCIDGRGKLVTAFSELDGAQACSHILEGGSDGRSEDHLMVIIHFDEATDLVRWVAETAEELFLLWRSTFRAIGLDGGWCSETRCATCASMQARAFDEYQSWHGLCDGTRSDR